MKFGRFWLKKMVWMHPCSLSIAKFESVCGGCLQLWDKHFMDEHVFGVLGLPVVVTGDLLVDALAQLPEGKRDVILLSYFLGMTDREISEKLNIVHQTVSKRRLITLKELREYLMKEGFEWSNK
ncbi:RNA polymerase sigma factor [Ruminococcus sp. 5_1_39BFAA]|uniref:RNA polymerase sigma factor n=1 Tax=Ruminococcus sp. 5_1_39BFAA TaxID=457412 RepID=UPI003566CBE4